MKIKPKNNLFCWLVSKRFPEAKNSDVFITWGDTCYSDVPLTRDLIVHESLHTEQQINKLYGLWWWLKYMISAKFRFEQELECYKAQYKWAVKHYKMDRNQKSKALTKVALALSGTLYQNVVSFEEARKLLKNGN